MRHYLWLVPLLPLLGALVNGVVLRGRLDRRGVTAVAWGSTLLSLLVGFAATIDYLTSEAGRAHEAFEQVVWEWIPAGALSLLDGSFADFTLEMGFRLDALSCVMLFVVTFVGFLIHVYSAGYMAQERGYQRYFAYLNLFMGAMLLLVLGSNFLVLFVGWEGVGLCSYLLIGFYYEQEFPPYAGRKAFLVNRIGDFGFLIGLLALAERFGSLAYRDIFGAIEADPSLVTGEYVLGMSFATFVGLCLFVGACGKSAQIPLYVWLPDAMAGPTPVSALIHAATMVTAGVYMVVRSNALYQLSDSASEVVAVVGTLTALLAATIGLAQTDIKKVLAYSTVSQLGYMFLAAGVGAYSAAIFHLGTHAFFKALLFLGSGSVIHALGGEQDMRRMGGLKAHLPATYRTFLVGTVAIAGLPPLAGFFSKDQILAGAWGSSKLLWGVGLATAGLTACYMFRLLYLTFWGEFRGSEEQAHHLHESPPVMTVPLWILAAGAVGTGLLGLPFFSPVFADWIGHFLAPAIAHVGEEHGHHAPVWLELVLMGVSVAVALLGIWMATRTYKDRGLEGGEAWAARFPAVHRTLVEKYKVDELYDATVVRPLRSTARRLRSFLDRGLIDGLVVHGSAFATELAGDLLRFTVTGNLRTYALWFLAGVVLLFWWIL
jgi:NADH-quinone oxidoreductase subunit L